MLLNEQVKYLQELTRKLKAIEDEARRILLEIVQEDNEKGIFEDFNRVQLFRSLDSLNNPLGFYTTFTIIEKRKKGTYLTNEIILFDEGDLYSNIVTDVVDNSLVFRNEDPNQSKIRKVVDRFGPAIFGLSTEDQNTYIHKSLKPRLMERLKKFIEQF